MKRTFMPQLTLCGDVNQRKHGYPIDEMNKILIWIFFLLSYSWPSDLL
jgi:hypothetical protein